MSAVHIHLDGPQRGTRVNWPWIGYIAERVLMLAALAALGAVLGAVFALAFIAAGGSL